MVIHCCLSKQNIKKNRFKEERQLNVKVVLEHNPMLSFIRLGRETEEESFWSREGGTERKGERGNCGFSV